MTFTLSILALLVTLMSQSEFTCNVCIFASITKSSSNVLCTETSFNLIPFSALIIVLPLTVISPSISVSSSNSSATGSSPYLLSVSLSLIISPCISQSRNITEFLPPP